MGALGHRMFRLFIRHKSVSFITVESVRVGLVLRTLQAAILFYAAYQLFVNKRYMDLETPAGFCNTWIEGYGLPADAPAPAFCDNADYDFEWGFGWVYQNNSCRRFELGEVVRKLPNGGITLQSYFQDSVITKTGCEPRAVECDSINKSSANFFVPGVDGVRIGMETSMHTSLRRERNVHTTVVNYAGGTIREFAAGEPIFLTLSEVLSAAGVESLDSINADAYIPESSGRATFRLTGLLLLFELHFTNLQSGFYGEEVSAVLSISNGKVGWVGEGPRTDMVTQTPRDDGKLDLTLRDFYSYGMKFQVLYTGSIGEASFYAAINSIVTYSVLLTLAGMIADVVAEYFGGSATSAAFKARKRLPIELEGDGMPVQTQHSGKRAIVVPCAGRER
mmetsp:Transcript_25798/g.73070  ORF Transcript_25798/g.73070 Transcript_25798/m.73070 type:complete len:392 (+) Transcript_25798:106-1281(+)